MPSGTLKGLAQVGQIVGPIISAQGTIAGGQERLAEANAQANQLTINAGKAQAVGQRNAINTNLQTSLTLSRQQAVAAASNAGAFDPTVQNIEAITKSRGEYASLTDLYNGNSEAQDMLIKAAYTKAAGQDAMAQTNLEASKTLAGGVTTLLDRYGGQTPGWF